MRRIGAPFLSRPNTADGAEEPQVPTTTSIRMVFCHHCLPAGVGPRLDLTFYCSHPTLLEMDPAFVVRGLTRENVWPHSLPWPLLPPLLPAGGRTAGTKRRTDQTIANPMRSNKPLPRHLKGLSGRTAGQTTLTVHPPYGAGGRASPSRARMTVENRISIGFVHSVRWCIKNWYAACYVRVPDRGTTV